MRHPTITLPITLPGVERDMTLFDTGLCLHVVREIFGGESYPLLPESVLPRESVKTVVDVGANIGASVLWWLSNYPQARIVAYEPCEDAYALLMANIPEERVKKIKAGLGVRDRFKRLYHGPKDDVENSCVTVAPSFEDIPIADAFVHLKPLWPIDILKIDTEGSEVEIITALGAMYDVRVVYLEYHRESDRLEIAEHMRDTHTLWYSHSERPHRGELCYVRNDLIPHEYAKWEIKS